MTIGIANRVSTLCGEEDLVAVKPDWFGLIELNGSWRSDRGLCAGRLV